jgi:Flp pilus assembly protein TadG
MQNILSKLKNEKGQSTVEFALIGILLLLLFFGIVEFGRAWFYADLLKGAANDTARTYAVSGAVAGQAKRTFYINDAAAKNRTIEIIFSCQDASGNPVLCTASPAPESVTSAATLTFQSKAPIMLPMLNNIPITRTATYRIEQ